MAYERPMMRGIIVVWMFWTSPAYSTRVTVGIGGSMPKNTAKPPSSGSTRLRSASAQKSSLSSASFSGFSAATSCAWLKSSGR